MKSFKQQAIELGATQFSRAHNFTNKSEVSSVHFFRPMTEEEQQSPFAVGCNGLIEVGYYFPSMAGSVKTLVPVERYNPVDVVNTYPMADF